MVGRTVPLRGTLGRGAEIDVGGRRHHFHELSVAAVLIAALVAGLAALFRPDDSSALPEPPPPVVVASLAVQVVLPGVGSGAPANITELRDVGILHPSGSDSPATVTARRYASHLAADIVEAPRLAVEPLHTAAQVQNLVAVAANPALVRVEPPAQIEETLSESALLVRLGLAPGTPLPPSFPYEVQRGDSVEKLARRFGLQAESILFNNWEIRNPDFLESGAQLTIPARDGVVYTVLLGDTLFGIAENYAAEVDDVLAFEGNGLESPDHFVEGSTILLVGGSASVAFGFGAAGPVYAIPEFRWPIGGIMCDFYGTPRGNRYGYHTGIDVCAPTGTFIGAAAPGVVVQAGWDGGFGQAVLVDHGGGVVTRYAHMSHIDVFLGEYVEAGDLIGFVGSTGYSTGAHLHFEIFMGGASQDPLVWLNP